MTASEHLQQMALAARLYYQEGRTQDEVARHLGVSRPSVSRLLQQARNEGIVQITIHDPFTTDLKLATAVSRAAGLEHVVVVPGDTADVELGRKRLGQAGARYLDKTLRAKDVLGVGWGRTLQCVASAMEGHARPGLVAVPLLGGLGQLAPSFQVHELTRQLATAVGGSWRQLYMPAIVEDGATHGSLVTSRDMKAVMDEWRQLTVALIGVGNVDFQSEVQTLFAAYLDGATQRRLQAAGAVGDLCMRFLDRDGAPIADGLRGVIGIALEQLRRVPQVIAVAGGADKAEAILGAARGGFVDTLITDEAAARAILAREEGHR
jgi:DNA-binding transcriptional regulator LsrR (DeoR family)